MNDHAARVRFTAGQLALAGVIIAGQVALMGVFFPALFVTVNHMLGPSFDGWAWSVPIGTEVSFVIMYLLEVLLAWTDSAPGWLRAVPYVFFGLSLALNMYAGRASLGDMTGHAAIVVAFFLPLVAWKTAVRKFTTTPAERERDAGERDARTHARDILRAATGRRWWRAPVLLRRKVRRWRPGPLPADVAAAIARGAETGRGGLEWERAVERWIAASLTLPERVARQLTAARQDAAGPPPGGAAGPPPDLRPAAAAAAVEAPPNGAAAAVEAPPAAPSNHGREHRRTPVPGSPAWRPRTMSDDALTPYVEDELAADPGISQAQLAARLGIGDKRVRRILDARRPRLSAVR